MSGGAQKARAGHAEVTASIKDRISGGLAKIKAKMQSFAASSARIGGAAVGVGIAGLAPMAAGVKMFMDSGDQLNKMSTRTSISAENLSTMGFAAETSGSDLATFERGIIGMQKTIRGAEKGMVGATDKLDSVGVSMADLEGKTPDEQFKLLADGLNSIDESKRAAVAIELFGKAGQKLLPLLSEGSDGISKLQESAKGFGLEFSTADADSAATLNDRLFELTSIIKGTAIQIGAALAPALIFAATWLSHGSTYVLEFMRNNRMLTQIVAGVLLGVVAFGNALIALGGFVGIASFAVGGLITLLGVAGAVMAAIVSPIGLIGIALVGGVAAWLYFSESGNAAVGFLSDRLGQLLAWGQSVFGGIYDSIVAGDWQGAGAIMWAALRVAWATGIGALQTLWIDFKFGMFSAFDAVVTGIRSMWNSLTTSIAQGLIWILDQANAVSEAVAGFKLMETEGISEAIDQDNASFQKNIANNQIKREQARLAAIDEAKKKINTESLQAELSELIAGAAEKRKAFELTKSVPPTPTVKQKEAFAAPTQASIKSTSTSSLGSFSLAALNAFGTAKSKDEQILKATERVADATEELADREPGELVLT